MSAETITLQHIKETILAEDKEPQENTIYEKCLNLIRLWYSQSKIFRGITFKKIRKLLFSKCIGTDGERETQIRRMMIEVHTKDQERLKRIVVKNKLISDAKNRVAWEIHHDNDQATEIFPEEYLHQLGFR